jgi:hypothetical protein
VARGVDGIQLWAAGTLGPSGSPAMAAQDRMRITPAQPRTITGGIPASPADRASRTVLAEFG